jgi:hypothetical protein
LREHIWYFSPKTIKRMLEESGYEMVSIRSSQERFSLGYISKRLRFQGGWVGLLGQILNLPKPFSSLSFWVSSGEMVVTAQLKINKVP